MRRSHRCLPAVFLLGLPKCGTTDMWQALRHVPQVVPSRHKEPHFWTRRLNSSTPVELVRGFEHYMRLFSLEHTTAMDGLVLDASASTLWDRGRDPVHAHAGVPALLRAVYGEWASRLRFIVMVRSRGGSQTGGGSSPEQVRDPKARMWSDFMYFGGDGRNGTAEAFDDAVQEYVAKWAACIRKRPEIECAHEKRLQSGGAPASETPPARPIA